MADTDTADTGEVEPLYDYDGDGCSAPSDCDDANASVYPDATEICDAIDNDCDSVIDEDLPTATFYVDNDGDGYGAGEAISLCYVPESGYATIAGDCNDSDAAFYPGAEDIPGDGLDTDCDDETEPEDTSTSDGEDDTGEVSEDTGSDDTGSDTGTEPEDTGSTDTGSEEEPAVDADADGYSVVSDCNDSDSAINPGATETTDGVDNDCDGSVDEIDEGWEVIVEASYPVSGSYTLNTALYSSGSAPNARSWSDESTSFTDDETWVGYLTSEYGDVSGFCGLIVNGDGYGLDYLCYGGSRDTSVAFDIYFDGTWYTESNLEVWIADASDGECALILQVSSSTSCDPVNDI